MAQLVFRQAQLLEPPLAQHLPGGVAGDGVEPSREPVRVLQLVETPAGPDERLLRGVLDVVGIAEKRSHGPDHTRPVLVHEPAEGVLASLPAPGDEFLV